MTDEALSRKVGFTYADQDALALEVDISDRELVGKRHIGGVSTIVAAGSAELFKSFKNMIGKANEPNNDL